MAKKVMAFSLDISAIKKDSIAGSIQPGLDCRKAFRVKYSAARLPSKATISSLPLILATASVWVG